MKIKLIEENNDTIEKFKAVSNELLSDYSIVANIEIIKNYKDNPVPSLDDFVELCRQMIYLAGNNPKQKSYAIKTINKEFYKLQNGVENVKEQPKERKIILPNGQEKEIKFCSCTDFECEPRENVGKHCVDHLALGNTKFEG